MKQIDYPQIILFNGASSSGKTTLASKLWDNLPVPYLYLSSDQLVNANILPKVDRKNHDTQWSWNVIRPMFFDGFHNTIAAFAKAGNFLIVEHVIEKQEWFDTLVKILSPFSLLYIGVFCPIEEINKREKQRGDREIGEGRSHIEEGIHNWSNYDVTIDTFVNSVEENVQTILEHISKYNKEESVFRNY